jgi:hypothetical protein
MGGCICSLRALEPKSFEAPRGPRPQGMLANETWREGPRAASFSKELAPWPGLTKDLWSA